VPKFNELIKNISDSIVSSSIDKAQQMGLSTTPSKLKGCLKYKQPFIKPAGT
jgi:hypothetical protein